MTLIMEKKNYSKNSPEIILLRELIQKSVDFKIRTPADFNSLAELINEKTGEMLSPTTLKRLWGYIDGADTTRQCTLNILTKYLGYKSWDDFIADCEKHYEIQSKPILSYSISSATLNNGQKLILEWMPNRQIVIEYLGENKWIVTESKTAKCRLAIRSYAISSFRTSHCTSNHSPTRTTSPCHLSWEPNPDLQSWQNCDLRTYTKKERTSRLALFIL